MFHINAEGDVHSCRAKIRCPFGDADQHYATSGEARQAYEHSNNVFEARRPVALSPVTIKYRREDEQEFWDRLRATVGTIEVAGHEFAVQPDDGVSSTVYCITCGNALLKTNSYFTRKTGSTCDKCGTATGGPWDTSALLARSALPYLNDDHVRRSKWYHTTQRADWAESLAEPDRAFVHLGTEEAAADRTRTLLNDEDLPTYRFEVELDPTVPIDARLCFDDPYYDDDLNVLSDPAQFEKIEFNGVTRYVNEMEDPGSISLLANPKTMRVTSVVVVQPRSRV